ncbi:MAG: 3-deoxy-manno-octulosonate cytidylyltransferase [Halocynthiibacter sp.]
METVILIPARYGSTRFEGKPLAMLEGVSGERKSLIERSFDAAKAVKGDHAIYVATDDDRIADAARAFGADVVMTSDRCRNGTERCAEAIANLGVSPEVVVNLQGDAPLTPPWFIEALIDQMKTDPNVGMATPVLRCDVQTVTDFITDRKAGRVGGTTAVFDHHMNALYFSKEVLPYTDQDFKDGDHIPVFHHVGAYAYRPAALADYMSWSEGPLEKLEGLEQLRFLENGHKIRCVEVDGRGHVFWELNNPIDVERIERVLKEKGIG